MSAFSRFIFILIVYAFWCTELNFGLNGIINCNPGEDCVIDCPTDSVCAADYINCPTGYSCTITCSDREACWGAVVNASSSTELTIECTTGSFTCENINIYCPPNKNGIKKCHIAGDNDGLRGCDCGGEAGNIDDQFNLYAINGWLDTDFAGYTGNNFGSNGQNRMHCLSDYSATCDISSTDWSCTGSTHTCDLLTLSPTPLPSTSPTTYAPSSNPSRIPTSSPSNIPTNIPTNVPTNNPSSIPTYNPSNIPTNSPTTNAPSNNPSNMPTYNPTLSPTNMPTLCSHEYVTTLHVEFDYKNNNNVSVVVIDGILRNLSNSFISQIALDDCSINDYEDEINIVNDSNHAVIDISLCLSCTDPDFSVNELQTTFIIVFKNSTDAITVNETDITIYDQEVVDTTTSIPNTTSDIQSNDTTSEDETDSFWSLIMYIILGVILLCAILLCVNIYLCKRKKNKQILENKEQNQMQRIGSVSTIETEIKLTQMKPNTVAIINDRNNDTPINNPGDIYNDIDNIGNEYVMDDTYGDVDTAGVYLEENEDVLPINNKFNFDKGPGSIDYDQEIIGDDEQLVVGTTTNNFNDNAIPGSIQNDDYGNDDDNDDDVGIDDYDTLQ